MKLWLAICSGNMKVGIIHFMAYPQTMTGEGPVLETIRKIALDNYFEVVEISWIKDAEVRKQVKNTLDTAGMTIAYGGQPRLLTTGLNINDLNEEGRLKAVATLKEGIDEAYEMGAVGFAFLSGKYEREHERTVVCCAREIYQGALRLRRVERQYEGNPRGV